MPIDSLFFTSPNDEIGANDESESLSNLMFVMPKGSVAMPTVRYMDALFSQPVANTLITERESKAKPTNQKVKTSKRSWKLRNTSKNLKNILKCTTKII